MKVKVLRAFNDKPNKKTHKVEKIIDVSEERFEELKAVKGNPLVEEVESDNEINEFPKHTGGGWYVTSSGEKVKGKDEALEAENLIEEVE